MVHNMWLPVQQFFGVKGRARVSDRIITRVYKPNSLCLDGLDGAIEFVLAFAVVHEIPDVPKLFADLFPSLKFGAKCLIAEPKGHVSDHDFELTLSVGEQVGLRVEGKSKITLCHAALLSKD